MEVDGIVRAEPLPSGIVEFADATRPGVDDRIGAEPLLDSSVKLADGVGLEFKDKIITEPVLIGVVEFALRSVVIPDMNIVVTEVVSLREAVTPFTSVGVYVVDWLDVGLITPTPPVEFITIVFTEITPETPSETMEVDIKAVSFMDAAVPLDGTAKAAVEGLKVGGVITPMPPAEFIVENPPDVSPEKTPEDTIVDIRTVPFVGTDIPLDSIAESVETGPKLTVLMVGVIAPVPPVEFIVEKPPEVSPEKKLEDSAVNV